MSPFTLTEFVAESNRIEGIGTASLAEVDAHRHFLAGPASVEGLVALVAVLQPDAALRTRVGMNVRVGLHYPPPGGLHIVTELRRVLDGTREPYRSHLAYETLHPFTDGNGRSGRALWLYDMGGIERAPLGFLHHWYYQSLQALGGRG